MVVDRRLVFGWRNSPGFYCLLAEVIEHAHGSTSFDDAVVTPQGLAATRHVRVDIPAAGETPEQILGEAGIGLITDVVASSTSANQLGTRLGERMCRVADLGTYFAG